MQVYYVLAGLYGWAVWHPHPAHDPGNAEKAPAAIVHTPLRQVPGLVGVYLAAHAAIYLLLVHFTNSTVPLGRRATTAASIVAMWMLSRRQVEQWLVWLAVDVVTAGLYLYKEIPPHRRVVRPLLGAGRRGLPPLAEAGRPARLRGGI